MTDNRVFRVTLRGQFADLSAETRAYLVKNQAEHDLFVSAYTSEGTLSYDERVLFFNLRYEIRGKDEGDAVNDALHEAEAFLQTMKFTHKPLKATVVDVSQTWKSPSEVSSDN